MLVILTDAVEIEKLTVQASLQTRAKRKKQKHKMGERQSKKKDMLRKVKKPQRGKRNQNAK